MVSERLVKITEELTEIFDQAAARRMLDDLTKVLDTALEETGAFVMRDSDGHIELVDGDVHTLELAVGVIEYLADEGWYLERINSAERSDR